MTTLFHEAFPVFNFFNQENFPRTTSALQRCVHAFLRATGLMSVEYSPSSPKEWNFYEAGANIVWKFSYIMSHTTQKVEDEQKRNPEKPLDIDAISAIYTEQLESLGQYYNDKPWLLEKDGLEYKDRLYETNRSAYYAISFFHLCIHISCALIWIALNFVVAAIFLIGEGCYLMRDRIDAAVSWMGRSSSIPVDVTPPTAQDSSDSSASLDRAAEQAKRASLNEQVFLSQVTDLNDRALGLDVDALWAQSPDPRSDKKMAA